MNSSKANPASQPDDENPEWTAQEIQQARPAADVLEAVFGPGTSKIVLRGRGRPNKPDRKVNQTLRLDPDVLRAYRQQGSGWQARINQVLREHMPQYPS